MVVASGFVSVDEPDKMESITGELRKRSITIDFVDSDKIIFLFEKESVDDVRNEIDWMRNIRDVRDVHLTYYSVEDPETGA